MDKLIKGIHHVAIKCADEKMFSNELSFYRDVLGFDTLRSWGSGRDAGATVNINGSVIELFASGMVSAEAGAINHFSLATDNVDACVEAARKFGCEIRLEPLDIVIPSDPPYPARIAFCVAPAGEEIEFFCEK